MHALIFTIEFFTGSLMFSYWIGHSLGINLKNIRDGNPGAFNLGHSAGLIYGILGASLDFFKGYFPLIFFLKILDTTDYKIIFIFLAPILGHAFSPFLKFKGGKALAVTFGVWSALTNFKISFIYAVILGILKSFERKINKNKPSIPEIDALLDLTGFGIVGVIMFMFQFNNLLLQFWLYNFVLLIFKRTKDIYAIINLFLNKEHN
ncbi:MAG: glycerol-3-phosphate acyltransferase [Thermosipho sp. (in: Bacteria)]|nr:glycerol-3-phosphate acyltransferase [Thermosipho sp. (in: thermotogales)]